MARDRAVIPGIPTDAARVIIDRMRAQEERIALLERKGGRAGIVATDTAAKVGELLNIEAPTAGLTIVLPQATQALRNARITLAFRNSNPVRIVSVLGTVNGEEFVLNDRAGTYDAICDGLGGWSVQVGVTDAGSGAGGGGGSSAPDAEYVVGAAHASLPSARLATDSAEVDAVLTTPNVITWALNVASVAFSKLANLSGLSVLGRAANSSGVMAAITATAGSQHLVTNVAGTAVEWQSQLSASHDASVTGALGDRLLPSTVKSGDILTFVLTGNTTLTGLLMSDGSDPPDGFLLYIALRDQSGGAAPGWTLTILDDNTGPNGRFRTPGQVQGTTPGPSYVMQSEEEGITAIYAAGGTNRWRIVGGTAAQAITGDITVASGNGATRDAQITAGVIVNADVNASAAIAQTKLGATTGFSVKASGASATTSAEPIVTYSASANMSAERVTTSSTTVTVDTTVASQIEFRRAALTGHVTAPANSNATTIAADVVTPAMLAVLASSVGTAFVIHTTFAAGGGGAADDVTIFSANAPFAFRIIRMLPRVITGAALGTLQARNATAGGGAAVSSTFAATAAFDEPVVTANMGATATIALNGTLVVRRSDSGIAGEASFLCVRT